MSDNIRLLTVGEIATLLRVDQTTVRRWIHNGSLPAIELPKRASRTIYRVKQSEIDKLLGK